MGYLSKMVKYFVCVGLTMICIILFSLVFANNTVLLTPHGQVDIPLYFSFGWGVYQFAVNRIHEQNLDYYWMIIKLTIQTVSIGAILFFVMMKIVG